MRVAKHAASGLVPVAIALTALLNARMVNALLEETIGTSLIPNAQAATQPPRPTPKENRSADTILARNIFDSTYAPKPPGPSGPIDESAQCEGIRPLVLVGSSDPDIAFAAVEVAGKKVLGRRGDDINGMKIAYVAVDRLWLERNGTFCQSQLFGPKVLPNGPVLNPAKAGQPSVGSLESDLAGKITKLSATDMQVDRSVIERLLDAQTELMKIRLVPEKDGERVLGMKVANIKPGSALGMLGVENGDRLETINGMEVTSPEKMLSAWTQLRAGTLDKVSVHVNRNGKGVNLDYQVK